MSDSESIPVISLQGVSKSFGDIHVLKDVSLEVPTGKTTAIIGPSGAGKSVILRHMVGLLQPETGAVFCFGHDIVSASESALFAVRRRMGMLFQDGALFDSLSVGENIRFPLRHHAAHLSAAEQWDRVDAKLSLVGLPGFRDRDVASLSGGQRKRVGLARAIIMEPEVVLFDEPNSGLDPITSDAIDALILEMKEKLGITFVVISHDIVGTVNVADHIHMVHGGKVIASGPKQAFLESGDPLVRQFLSRNLVLPSGGGMVAQLPDAG